MDNSTNTPKFTPYYIYKEYKVSYAYYNLTRPKGLVGSRQQAVANVIVNMNCLNPKPVKFFWTKIVDKKTGEIRPTKTIKFLGINDKVDLETDFIPCGKCEGCKVNKANDWATRAFLESQNHTENCFLTLTYNNDNLPKPKTLIKRDLQLFWKRLRKKIYPQKISYLAAGEYGLKTRRPHYHAAVFNFWPDDATPHTINAQKDILYTSKTIEKIWGKGFVIIGRLTYQSAAYIARYVYKKAYGKDILNLKKHQTPEFITCSKRPAIAKNYFFNQNKWEKIMRNNGIIIPTKDGTKIKPIPRYLLEKWKTYDWKNFFQWQEKNKKDRIENTKKILEKTDKNLGWYQKQIKEIKKEKLDRLDKLRKEL